METQQVFRHTVTFNCADLAYPWAYAVAQEKRLIFVPWGSAPVASANVAGKIKIMVSTGEKQQNWGTNSVYVEANKRTFAYGRDDLNVYNDDGTFNVEATTQAYLDYMITNEVTFAYETLQPVSVEPIAISASYTAYIGGTETTLPTGETVTVTQDYYEIAGGAE